MSAYRFEYYAVSLIVEFEVSAIRPISHHKRQKLLANEKKERTEGVPQKEPREGPIQAGFTAKQQLYCAL